MLAAQGPESGTPAARQLRLAALDQEALWHYDSALVLFRAARQADPHFFAAHLGYIDLMRRRRADARLRTEYAALFAGDSTPLGRCLVRVTRTAYPGDAPRVAESLRPLVKQSVCAAYYFAGAVGYVDSDGALDAARRLVEGAPELGESWQRYATVLEALGRSGEVGATLEEGATRVVHASDRAQLLLRLIAWNVARGDTAKAKDIAADLHAAVARDGRPELWGIFTNVVAPIGTPRGGEDADPERLRRAREAGSWLEEFDAAGELGHGLLDTGRPGAAIPFATRQVAIADSVGEPGLRLVAYSARGRAYLKLGRLREASRDLLRAVRYGDGAGIPYYLAEAYHNLAHMYEAAGRLTEASRAVERFVALTRPMRYSDERMMSLHDAGVIHWKAGWHAAARADFEEMVRAVDTLRDQYYWAGEYFERIGDLGQARRYYEAGTGRGFTEQAESYKGLARVFESLSELDSAESAARSHDGLIAYWPPLETPLVPGVLAGRGDFTGAVRVARAWAQRQLAGGNIEGASLARLQVAGFLLDGGDPAGAAAEAAAAESLAARLNLTDEVVDASRLRGVALVRGGRRTEGLSVLRFAAATASAHPTAESVLSTQVALGDALAAERPDAALEAYDRAARTVEGMTRRLDADLERSGFREQHLAPFDGALRVLLRDASTRGRLESWLRWSARRKGAALALATQFSLRPQAPGPSRLTLGEVRARLGPGEILLDYTLLDSAAAVLAVTRDHADLIHLRVSADSLGGLVERLRRPLIAAYAGRVDLARAPYDLGVAAALYADLLGPVEDLLRGVRQVIVVPDGQLAYLPFEALVAGGVGSPDDYLAPHYAIDDRAFEYLPTVRGLSGWSERGRPIGPGPAGVLGVTRDAPGGEREIAGLAAAWGRARVTTMMGAQATESAVRSALGRHAILHLAVHASVDAADPLASYLALAPDAGADGYLHLNEIVAQRIAARLVVLSACETQAGRVYRGEGVMSLARAFLMSGADAVVATEWPLGPSAADLTFRLHTQLAAGQPLAASLRAAKLALRRDPRTAHPFYWAGFVLIEGGR